MKHFDTKDMGWHLSASGMKTLAKDSVVTEFDLKSTAEPCTNRKLYRCAFPARSATRTSEPLGLVHSDMCGKISPKSAGGAEYFLTLTIDKSWYVRVYPLKTNDEAFGKFTEWKSLEDKSSG